MCAFAVLDLVFSTASQKIGLGKCLRNDLFCVKWVVKPQLSQSIRLELADTGGLHRKTGAQFAKYLTILR